MIKIKTLKQLESLSHSAYVDDEREDGSSIIVTLKDGYEFAGNPGCGVQGFDTVKQAILESTGTAIKKLSNDEFLDWNTLDDANLPNGCFIVSQVVK